jgi:hypothetical protein
MSMTRRDFVKRAGIASAVVPALTRTPSREPVQTKPMPNPVPVRGMTDWNLSARRHRQDRSLGNRSRRYQVACSTDGRRDADVRDAKTQAAFRQAALNNGIQICSL